MAISTFFSGFFRGFTSNISKLRKALMEYFKEEGIGCEMKDGDMLFHFNDNVYVLRFAAGSDYAECAIIYECAADEYTNLELDVKTFIADKVNTEQENHSTVYAYNDSFKVASTFYFTSKRMLMDLFVKHFNELNESVDMALDIISDNIADNAEGEKPKKIGFCVPEQNENTNGNDVAAVAKK